MRILAKILGALLAIVVLLVIAGFVQTYRNEHNPYQEQFSKGSIPNPYPNGFLKGGTDFYQASWQGKVFDVNAATGINRFSSGEPKERYPFKTYEGKGLQDIDLTVFKIDYQNGQNPFWVSPVLDEIVQVAPGQYLGKIHYRLIPGFPFTLGYFRLETDNLEQAPIRNITVKSKYFSVKLPQDWKVDFEDAKDIRLTELLANSPDFTGRSETVTSTTSTPLVQNYIEGGAKLDILVEKGQIAFKEKLDGKVISSENVTIGNIKTKLHVLTNDNTPLGQYYDARFVANGNSYIFRMAYNPEKYPTAKKILENVFESFTFISEQ